METNQQMLQKLKALLRAKKERPCPGGTEFGCRVRMRQPIGTTHIGAPPSLEQKTEDPTLVLVPIPLADWVALCPGGCGGTGTITDPRMQAAWELLTQVPPPAAGWLPLLIGTWPDGAVRGLLEQVMETICGIENFHWPHHQPLQMLFEVITEEVETRSIMEALDEQH